MSDKTRKVAVVTGAGTGIGRACALALVRAGYAVTLAGRRREALEATAAAVAGAETLVVPCNVADAAAVEQLFGETVRRFGRVDLLFNNAGGGAPPLPIDELSVEQWKSVIDANLTGSFLCARQAVRFMKRQKPQGGRIINNGSISAHAPRPNSTPYTASKHAITGLTKCLSLDGRPFNIACGQIDIGNAATEMTERMKNGVMQADGRIAAEPRMDVEHVAQAVVFMAGLPLESNVQFMTIMATNMPFVGRG